MKEINPQKPIFIRQIFLSVLLVLSSHTYAREYAIEMVFFMHIDGEQVSNENFPNNLKLVPSDQGLLIDNDYPRSELQLSVSKKPEEQWRALSSDQFILNDVVKKLEHSRDYKVLKHIAWRQPVVDHKNAQAIKIQGGRNLNLEHPDRLPAYSQPNDAVLAIIGDQHNDSIIPTLHELEGSVTVVITRYIHVYADLILHAEQFVAQEHEGEVRVSNQLQDYKIDLHRKMRSRELHYLDHPLVGIIVEATPIETPKKSPEEGPK